MSFNIKSLSAFVIGLGLTTNFINCSSGTNFNTAEDSSLIQTAVTTDTPVADSNVPDLSNISAPAPQIESNSSLGLKNSGRIIHRPLCFPTHVSDYQSYCNVRATNLARAPIDGLGQSEMALPSCEIVVNGQSAILHLLGPDYIGTEVNGRALRLNYADYMTLAEYNSAKVPCDLAIQRAAAAQDQKAREKEELEWGENLARLLAAAATATQDRVIQQKIAGIFVLNHYSSQSSMNTVHCVWMHNEGLGECGNSHIPRWKNPPENMRTIAVDTDYNSGTGRKITLDEDLDYTDYFDLCTQCGH